MVLIREGDTLDSGVPDHGRHNFIAFVTINFVAEGIQAVCDEIVFCLSHRIMWR